VSACPSCGGVLQQLEALVGVRMIPASYVRGRDQVYVQLQPRVVTACTECEYTRGAE
jgi:hypothetical protein